MERLIDTGIHLLVWWVILLLTRELLWRIF